MDDQHGSLALIQKVSVISGPQGCARGHGDRANLDRREVSHHKIRRIRQQQQNPLLSHDSEPAKPVSRAVNLFGDLRVCERSVFIQDGRPLAASFAKVAIDEMVGQVERIDSSAHVFKRSNRSSTITLWSAILPASRSL